MGARRDELLRLVVALSSACKKDNNVLKDAELVDALETQGRHIVQLREQRKMMIPVNQPMPTMSPLRETVKMAKKFKEQVSQPTEGTVKRRKLSLDTESKSSIKINTLDEIYSFRSSSLFPSIEHRQKSQELKNEWISSPQNDTKTKPVTPSDKEVNYQRTTPPNVAVAGEASEESVMVNLVKTNRVRRSMSPQVKTPRGVYAAPPSKQLSGVASPNSVDLGASSTSTMASYYDDMCDEYAVCSESVSRYPRSDLHRTTSIESMDWTPSNDVESMQFRSIADDVEQQSPVSRIVNRPSLSRQTITQLHIGELYSNSNTEEGEPTAEASSCVSPVKQKIKLPVTPSLTEVVMEVLYGIMEHNENFKWLIDPANQARVAKLVEYHIRENQNGDSSNQVHDNEHLENELRIKVDELIHENLRIKTENVRLKGKDSQAKVVDKNVEELQKRLKTTEKALSMQKEYRREAEIVFQKELESKSELLCSIQRDLEEKNSQITTLLTNGAELSSSDDTIRDLELARLKNTVVEKDREICRLNCQLSTKQKLVDEIGKLVVQELGTTHDISSNGTIAAFDMDMLLFKSLTNKQEIIEELKAALVSMEREVSSLEARVAKKSRDTLLLKTKLKSMFSRLTEAKVNMSRVQSENDRLVASLKDKQGKMHDLIEFLEDKEKQVMYLEEQVNLRETQLDHVMTEYKKTTCYQLDNMPIERQMFTGSKLSALVAKTK